MNLMTEMGAKNTRRLRTLVLNATSLEEEFILHSLFEVIKGGGRLILEPDKESYPPRHVVFPGMSDTGD